MSDKYLTVKEWQKFAAERAFKESAATKAMVKALAAAEKAGNATPAEQLEVLDALEAAGRDLLKLHKGDKKLESYLEDVYKPLKKYRKEAEKTQAKEEKAEAKAAKAEAKADAKAAAEGDDDDEDGPAFLEPKRLYRQLNLCKADPALRVHFAYIDGQDKEPGALGLSPKLSGVAMFKKLVLATGIKTGAHGTAWVDGTELMLQPDKPLGGLARKLRAPVKACGFKVTRIVLCNPDGSVLEAEAGEAEDGAAERDEGAPIPPPATTAEAPAAAPAPAAPAPSLEAQFIARLKALMPRLAVHVATREGQAAKLLASEAGLLARKADFAAALKNLDKIDLLLARLAGAPPSPPTAAAPATAVPAAAPEAADAPAAPAPAAPRFDADALRRAREQWRDASEAVDDQLNALRLAVVQGARTEPAYAEALAQIAGAGLNAVTGRHRVQIAVALRELGDGAPARVEAHGEKALAAVRAFRQFLRTSPQIAACDANPFEVDVEIRTTLEPALDALAEALAGD